MKKPYVNARIIRWFLLLLQFDLTIIDKPSKENVVADFLSRVNLPAGEEGMMDEQIPDEHLFSMLVLSPWFSHIENYLVSTQFPPHLSLKEEQDSKEKCPFHLDWGQSLQTWPRSDLEKMCQGGRSLWHHLDLSWWALWRSFCSKNNYLHDATSRLPLAHSSSRCEEIYQPVWSMSEDGETYSKGWDAHETSSDLWTIWEVGHGLCGSYQSSFKEETTHHCVH